MSQYKSENTVSRVLNSRKTNEEEKKITHTQKKVIQGKNIGNITIIIQLCQLKLLVSIKLFIYIQIRNNDENRSPYEARI